MQDKQPDKFMLCSLNIWGYQVNFECVMACGKFKMLGRPKKQTKSN